MNLFAALWLLNQSNDDSDCEREERQRHKQELAEQRRQRKAEQQRYRQQLAAQRRRENELKAQRVAEQKRYQQQLREQERIRKQQLAEQKRQRQAEQERYRQELAEKERLRKKQLKVAQQEKFRQERIHQQQLAEKERIRKEQLAKQRRQQIEQLQSHKQYVITQKLKPKQIELSNLQNQIATEEESIKGMRLERNDNSKKIIICVGKTGHGKSTFVNRLAGDTSLMADKGPCTTSNSAQSCTKSLQKINCGKLCIIDCPGWADSGGADRHHSNNLCAFLKGCGGINGIVLVRNATEYRFDADFQKKLKHLANIFGDDLWDNLIIVLTHVEKGIGQTQFIQNNKADEMRREIAKLSHKNIAYPIIAVGLDNYKDKLRLFINEIPNGRFICDRIKSPIDSLKARKQTVVDNMSAIQAKVDGIQNQIDTLVPKKRKTIIIPLKSKKRKTCDSESDDDSSLLRTPPNKRRKRSTKKKGIQERW